MKTPVVMIVFNRPDTTRRVFDVVATMRPEKMLIIADGPRRDRDGEAELCRQTRAVFDEINWPCLVECSISEENLGCKKRLSTGLDWVFSKCEQAIILEDDCLPHVDFFRYCEEMLEHWQDNGKIMAICGTNLGYNQGQSDGYFFTRTPHCWGWASWRRAWQEYDVEMKSWIKFRSEGKNLAEIVKNEEVSSVMVKIFDDVVAGKIDTWDYQWAWACWFQNGLCVVPNRNLISNIGFRKDATHTTSGGKMDKLKTYCLEFPLKQTGPMSCNESFFVYSMLATCGGGARQGALQVGVSRARKLIRKFFSFCGIS